MFHPHCVPHSPSSLSFGQRGLLWLLEKPGYLPALFQTWEAVTLIFTAGLLSAFRPQFECRLLQEVFPDNSYQSKYPQLLFFF